VGWGKSRPRMKNHEPSANGRCANGSRFGLGGLVPAADSGFRRACPWGGQRTLSRTHGRKRMDGVQMGSPSVSGRACPCGGFWVSAGVSVGCWSTDSVTDSRTRSIPCGRLRPDPRPTPASCRPGLLRWRARRFLPLSARARQRPIVCVRSQRSPVAVCACASGTSRTALSSTGRHLHCTKRSAVQVCGSRARRLPPGSRQARPPAQRSSFRPSLVMRFWRCSFPLSCTPAPRPEYPTNFLALSKRKTSPMAASVLPIPTS